MSYDWGWGTPLAQALIPKLPKDTSIISISEWSQPVSRGGVKTTVGEYSMSVVGPGPRATRNWELAQKARLEPSPRLNSTTPGRSRLYRTFPCCRLFSNTARISRKRVSAESWLPGHAADILRRTCRAAAAYAFEPRPQTL